MNNNIKIALAFFSGVCLGGGTAYLVATRVNQKKNDEIINEYEKAIKDIREIYKDTTKEVVDLLDDSVETVNKNLNEETTEPTGPVEYSKVPYSEPLKDNYPFVIKPEEVGSMEDEGYEERSCVYYTDGVLVDEYGKPYVNVESIVGYEALTMFGAYSENGEYDDVIWVRNPRLKTDYEIKKSDERYSAIPPEEEPYDE